MLGLKISFILSLLGIIFGFGYNIKLGSVFHIIAIYVFFGFDGLRALRQLIKKELGVDISS